MTHEIQTRFAVMQGANDVPGHSGRSLDFFIPFSRTGRAYERGLARYLSFVAGIDFARSKQLDVVIRQGGQLILWRSGGFNIARNSVRAVANPPRVLAEEKFFFCIMRRPPISTLFPYTTLFR